MRRWPWCCGARFSFAVRLRWCGLPSLVWVATLASVNGAMARCVSMLRSSSVQQSRDSFSVRLPSFAGERAFIWSAPACGASRSRSSQQQQSACSMLDFLSGSASVCRESEASWQCYMPAALQSLCRFRPSELGGAVLIFETTLQEPAVRNPSC